MPRIPLGFVSPSDDEQLSYIYNHVMLVIRYHREKKPHPKMVGILNILLLGLKFIRKVLMMNIVLDL